MRGCWSQPEPRDCYLQSELTPKNLAAEVVGLLEHTEQRKQMSARALSRGRPRAARDIVSNLLTLAS